MKRIILSLLALALPLLLAAPASACGFGGFSYGAVAAPCYAPVAVAAPVYTCPVAVQTYAAPVAVQTYAAPVAVQTYAAPVCASVAVPYGVGMSYGNGFGGVGIGGYGVGISGYGVGISGYGVGIGSYGGYGFGFNRFGYGGGAVVVRDRVGFGRERVVVRSRGFGAVAVATPGVNVAVGGARRTRVVIRR